MNNIVIQKVESPFYLNYKDESIYIQKGLALELCDEALKMLNKHNVVYTKVKNKKHDEKKIVLKVDKAEQDKAAEVKVDKALEEKPMRVEYKYSKKTNKKKKKEPSE